MTWLRNLWQRLMPQKLRKDDAVDSDFLRTTSIGIEDAGDMRVPGPDTHRLYTDLLRRQQTPEYWDEENERA